jgi:uncharacterized membrane protein YeaQ/YmgE (transglycosylase-associated protein family)
MRALWDEAGSDVNASGSTAHIGDSQVNTTMTYLIWEIAIGILAGFLAGKIMRGKGYGVLMDLALGLVGAVVGGFVFGLLGLHGYGLVGQLVVATAGAVMLIWLVRRL